MEEIYFEGMFYEVNRTVLCIPGMNNDGRNGLNIVFDLMLFQQFGFVLLQLRLVDEKLWILDNIAI